MSRTTKLLTGLLFIIIPTIEYGGYHLLTSLIDPESGYMANVLRQNFFRAGHAHAGVWVILAIVAQVFVDHANLAKFWEWVVRIGVIIAPLTLPFGFFLSMWATLSEKPNDYICLIYIGAIALAISVIILGIGLLRSSGKKGS